MEILLNEAGTFLTIIVIAAFLLGFSIVLHSVITYFMAEHDKKQADLNKATNDDYKRAYGDGDEIK